MSRKKTKNHKRFEEQLRQNEQQLSAAREKQQYLDLKETGLAIELQPNEKFKPALGIPDTWVSQYGQVIRRKKNGKYYLAKLTQDIKNRDKIYYRVWLGDEHGEEYVHRIVAEVWCKGYDAELRNEVHHIDHNGLNNYYKNLIWLNKVQHSFYDRDVKLYFMNNRGNSDFVLVDDLVDVAQRIKIDIRVLGHILSGKAHLKSGNMDIYEVDMGGTFSYYFALERPKQNTETAA